MRCASSNRFPRPNCVNGCLPDTVTLTRIISSDRTVALPIRGEPPHAWIEFKPAGEVVHAERHGRRWQWPPPCAAQVG